MAKTINAVVHLNKVKSTYFGGHTFSVRAEEDLQVGIPVVLGDVEVDNLEVYGAVAPTEGATVALVSEPAIDRRKKVTEDLEEDFFIKAGTVFRAHELAVEDFFSVTAPAIDDAEGLTEKDFLVADGFRWKKADAKPETGTCLQFVTKKALRSPNINYLTDSKDSELYVMRVVQI